MATRWKIFFWLIGPTSILLVSSLSGSNASERVMVFAPHPDDEMLTCAGVMTVG